MHFPSAGTSDRRNKVMTPDQFKQVVDAITEGRYSWACVLILRFAGYNPVHFIPYRTYSRLLKENRLLNASSERQPHPAFADRVAQFQPQTQIKELTYVETIEAEKEAPHGGSFFSWFNETVKGSCVESLDCFSYWRSKRSNRF